MPYINNPNKTGSYVPTTYIWDVSEIYSTEINSPEFKELLVRMYQNINAMILTLNLKETALYPNEELVNGQQFFPTILSSTQIALRPDFRMTVAFGPLPNTSTKSVPHGIGITATYSSTRITVTATDQTGLTMIPIPYASATTANIIEVNIDAVNINITTNSNRTNYTICTVVIEYLKN